MIEIFRCQVTHTVKLAHMLGRAFLHDPLYEFAFPEAATRATLISWDMGNIVRYGMRFGEVIATSGLSGCAVWLPPGETDFTEERMAQVGVLDTANPIDEEAEKRLSLFVSASEVVHRRIIPSAHWYLVLLGVDPHCQAQGIGSALLAGSLARADEGRLPIYLETTKAGNLPFYEKRGFVVRWEETLADSGPTIWYMVREPHEKEQSQ